MRLDFSRIGDAAGFPPDLGMRPGFGRISDAAMAGLADQMGLHGQIKKAHKHIAAHNRT